eukprot:Nitzschia sp. Nitz4//scaffold231_size31564//6377//13062//NITZ4_007939-RA/size31564-augustus-gene-0.27-mRNA-1//-1//CDS//3329543290//1436//frame0
MSMSTLGNQLAALQNANRGNATAQPTSRRHEDAVGRGISHSVNLGHSTTARSHLFKASILLEDAKAAAKVPLSTVQENCVLALRELEELDPAFSPYISQLCQNATERGMQTKEENSKIDSAIQELLYRLAPRMNTSKSVTSSCLHVVEFLLRRYDLHLRPALVHTALLVLLPHHEQPFFLRFLQLVDLASLPIWIFLRPYAVPNARVGRDAISKQVSKNVALLRDLLGLASKTSTLPEHDSTLSFVAATVVEAMVLQQRANGTLDERTCQALLPTIIQACRSANGESMRNFGYILASTLGETAVLASDPKDHLVSSILQGVVDCPDEDAKASALVVALTLLRQPYDLKATVEPTGFGVTVGSVVYGLPMEKTVLQTLIKIEQVDEVLGKLLADQGLIDIRHWIASIFVVGWKRIQRNKKESAQIAELLLALLADPRLAKTMWNPEWVESLTCFVLSHATGMLSADDSHLKVVLRTLKEKSARAYDQGVAKALLSLKKAERNSMAEWLGLSRQIETSAGGNPSEAIPSIQLPARVALEHADVEIRLDAIDRLVAEAKESDDMDVDDSSDETVVGALLRRALADDDVTVSSKAASAVDTLTKANTDSDLSNHIDTLIQVSYKWFGYYAADNEALVQLTVNLLHLWAKTSSVVLSNLDKYTPVVELVGAHLLNQDEVVASEAAKLVVQMLTGKSARSKASDKDACKALMSNQELLAQFHRPSTESNTENLIRRKFFTLLLKCFSQSMGKASKSGPDVWRQALQTILWGLTAHGSTLTEEELKAATNALTDWKSYICGDANLLISTFSTLVSMDTNVFEAVSRPFMIDASGSLNDTKGTFSPGIAVIGELALRPLPPLSVERLLDIAGTLICSYPEACLLALVPGLALIEDNDEAIRKKAVSFLHILVESMDSHKEHTCKALSGVCEYIKKNESSVLLGSKSVLPEALNSIVSKSKAKSEPQTVLLRLCVKSAVASASTAITTREVVGQGWIPFQETCGGQRACLVLLSATRLAGEISYPLLSRWSHAGKPLLDLLHTDNARATSTKTGRMLLEHVASMLKGVTVPVAEGDSAKGVIISSGPASRGGRKRSYSFGKGEIPSFISPFPGDMLSEILAILQSTETSQDLRVVRSVVIKHTLASDSWGKNIFASLSSSSRLELARSLLSVAADDLADSAEDAFFNLPLTCKELTELLDGAGESLAPVTYVADYTVASAKKLAVDDTIASLLVGLFQMFTSLARQIKHAALDEVEFACSSLLDSLNESFAVLTPEEQQRLQLERQKGFGKWTEAIVSVVGVSDATKEVVSLTPRGKRAAFSVLTHLATLYPSAVVPKLVPAIVSMISPSATEKDAEVVSSCLGAINGVFFENAASIKLSQSGLMRSFIAAANTGMMEETRTLLYRGFLDSLAKNKNYRHDHLGAFVATCLASELFYSSSKASLSQAPQLLSDLMNQETVSIRILVLLSLVAYAEGLVQFLSGEDVEPRNKILGLQELRLISEHGPTQEGTGPVSTSGGAKDFSLCMVVLAGTSEVVASPAFARYLHHSQVDSSAAILRLWQQLLMIQHIANNKMAGLEKEQSSSWSSISEVTGEILGSVQNHIPCHIFLAFVSSLIEENDSNELRARALQLVAEKALSIDGSHPEAGLFRDLLPFLISVLKNSTGSDSPALLQQSALFAIESVVRNLCASGDNALSKYHNSIVEGLLQSSSFIGQDSVAIKKSGLSSQNASMRNRLCTALLCSASCIRVSGPRALAALPKLLPPVFEVATCVNEAMESQTYNDREEEKEYRLMQIATLRVYQSLVDTVPQFLSPYFRQLFSPHVLPSNVFPADIDDQAKSVKNATERLYESLATVVSPRQLLPPLTQSICKAQDASRIVGMTSIITMAIENASGSKLASQLDTIFDAGTYMLELATRTEFNWSLLEASNNMFLAFVLKLSEVHLRSLYTKLMAWRGSYNDKNAETMAGRRTAFWSLSALLASKLKAIFLPCLTSTFSDAVDELDSFAAAIGKRYGSKTPEGNKRQKLGDSPISTSSSAVLISVQTLLKCLEASLRSDAHNGGSWIRDGDSKRFEVLHSPLSKLLQCKVPAEWTSTSYQSFVQGNEDEGSVVECLVALASAAGDEQMWKPLNHSVLQAASHETRPEVRKAGITCLVSLVRSIGEEYMVLIPECLPVLSELLEDPDEEIAEMARECISMSEELLGESLEDSLR